jgi:hypothetical protein
MKEEEADGRSRRQDKHNAFRNSCLLPPAVYLFLLPAPAVCLLLLPSSLLFKEISL